MISESLTLDWGGRKVKEKGEFGLDIKSKNVRACLKREGTNFFSSIDNPGKKRMEGKNNEQLRRMNVTEQKTSVTF